MGQLLRPTRPVKLIVGMLSPRTELFDWAEQKMVELWGEIDISSEIISFNWSNYYAHEMGEGLLRKFVSFSKLIPPEQISSCKHSSNKLEKICCDTEIAKSLQTDRPINLDPGYIEPSKLVLVTTKNYSHRVFIGDSMYAEPTLHYHKGKWSSWPFTYPDYGSGRYDTFLTEVRERLTEQLRLKN